MAATTDHATGVRKDRWNIERLLATGVQPFEDLSDEDLSALADGLRKNRPLAVPVVLSRDGILIDGHQRLRILLAQGQKTIGERDVRIAEDVSADNALEAAVTLNFRRRHLTAEDKGRLCARLMRTYGWSQGKVADVLRVHRPQVSRWLKGVGASTDADDPELIIPSITEGMDGRDRGVDAIAEANRGRPPSKPRPHPWSRKGDDLKSVVKLTHRFQVPEATDPLTPDERVILIERVEDMVAAAEAFVSQLRKDVD